MDINKLSPQERKTLMNQLATEEKAARRAKEENINAFKKMVDEMVNRLAPKLSAFGLAQNDIVNDTFADFDTIISLKKELYEVKDQQSSHTFTARDGNGSITIGYNEIIGFDGTEHAGVSKIKEVIKGLSADDENRAVLADLLNTFMKPDKKGNLNPTRIAELVSKKEMVNKQLFTEGVDIIVNAQFKTRSSMYVRGWHRVPGENGNEIKLSFSITAN